jgi:Fe-S cluster assembly protein SufB
MNDYKYGFSSDLNQNIIPKGLSEEVIRLISSQKKEPKWLLDYRLKSFHFWQKSVQPNWAKLKIDPIDYQAISYLAEVKKPKPTKMFKETKKDWLQELDKNTTNKLL